MHSIVDSLSKLETLAKAEEPIATTLNKFLIILIAKIGSIDFDPSKEQEIRRLIAQYGNSFMDTLREFIRIYSIIILLSQGYSRLHLIEDSDIEFIRENNLFEDSNEQINVLLEEAFLTAMQEAEEGKENNLCRNSYKSMICHLANYYSKVMDEIEMLPPLKGIINDILMHWIRAVSSIDVN